MLNSSSILLTDEFFSVMILKMVYVIQAHVINLSYRALIIACLDYNFVVTDNSYSSQTTVTVVGQW